MVKGQQKRERKATRAASPDASSPDSSSAGSSACGSPASAARSTKAGAAKATKKLSRGVQARLTKQQEEARISSAMHAERRISGTQAHLDVTTTTLGAAYRTVARCPEWGATKLAFCEWPLVKDTPSVMGVMVLLTQRDTGVHLWQRAVLISGVLIDHVPFYVVSADFGDSRFVGFNCGTLLVAAPRVLKFRVNA